jgi:phosphoribosylglycinamide formyltransferase-1
MSNMPRLAIFASGNGTNAQRIIEYFAGHPAIEIDLLLCNKQDAPVIGRAEKLHVSTRIFNRHELYETAEIVETLRQSNIDYLVLAGFLWLIPQNLLTAYPGRIINIHPALLPKYGGKGMYGMKVHEAIIAAGESESGITVHYVDENYDDGRIIFQAKCTISGHETPDSLAAKVHALEYRYFPEVIEGVVMRDGVTRDGRDG